MAKVTSFDINRIISGEPIPIETPYPLTDRGENPQWFMSQPSDWLYDMAIAVGEAAEAELMGQPEMVTAQTLPPSKSWMAVLPGLQHSLSPLHPPMPPPGLSDWLWSHPEPGQTFRQYLASRSPQPTAMTGS